MLPHQANQSRPCEDVPVITVYRSQQTRQFEVLRRAWTEETHGAPIDDPDYSDNFATWWDGEAGHRETWLADLDGVTVGMLSLMIANRRPRPGQPLSRWGYLASLYVLPHARGVGVGSALLDECLTYARTEGLVRVVLHPSADARPLYTRAGFAAVGDLLFVRHTG